MIDAEAEKAILSSIIKDPGQAHRAFTILSTQDFKIETNRLIFIGMKKLAQDNVPIDIVSINSVLEHKDIDYLEELEEFMPTSQALDHFADRVKDCSAKTKLVLALNQHIHEVELDGLKSSDIITRLRSDINDIADTLYNNKSDVDIFDPEMVATLSLDMAKERVENPGIHGIKTGFELLDECLKGLRQITVVSGFTGMGKTSFALNMACNIGIHQKVPTLYLNYEMGIEDLVTRIQGILTGLTCDSLLKGTFHADSWYKIIECGKKMREGKLIISGEGEKNIDETIDLIYRYHASHGIKVVFIDYLGEIDPDEQSLKEPEYMALGRWVQMLKTRCKPIGVKCVILAQLTRDSDDETPSMRHMAGSIMIVRKCNVMLAIGMNKEGYFIKVAKNRHGLYPVVIPLHFNKENQQIWEK